MNKVFFFLLIFIQSFAAFSQTLEYLNAMRYPVLDTSKYGYEYFQIITEKEGVIHSQIFNLDSVKIYHATALVDQNRTKTSERILSYYPHGAKESAKRIDYENRKTEEKNYYQDGSLKSDISVLGGEIVSEIYYAVSGEEIAKPVIEQASPKGGLKGWNSYLVKVLRYPSEARERGAEGTVLLEFDLDEQGMICNVRVGNPEFVHPALWKEAVRVVEAYPHKWTPKKENGKPIVEPVRLPIRFKLG
jgi:TonB family protein